jgi:hypothetical protein
MLSVLEANKCLSFYFESIQSRRKHGDSIKATRPSGALPFSKINDIEYNISSEMRIPPPVLSVLAASDPLLDFGEKGGRKLI